MLTIKQKNHLRPYLLEAKKQLENIPTFKAYQSTVYPFTVGGLGKGKKQTTTPREQRQTHILRWVSHGLYPASMDTPKQKILNYFKKYQQELIDKPSQQALQTIKKYLKEI